MANSQGWQVRTSFIWTDSILLDISKIYVDSILSNFPKERLHLSSPVKALQSLPTGQILLSIEGGSEDTFDHVILACHSDAALQILESGDVTTEESRILRMFTWNKNEAVLHADTKVNCYPYGTSFPNFC